MPWLPHKPDLGGLASKAKSAIQNVSGLLSPAAAQAARARAQATLDRLQRSPVAATPAGHALQQYISSQLARGEGIDDLVNEIQERAHQALDKQRRLVAGLVETVNAFRGGDVVRQLRTEVMHGARSGQLRGAEVWDRVTGVLKTPFPFLTWVERRIGPFTIGVCLQAKAGLAAGVGVGEGISGLRHCLACYSRQGGVAVGAIADVDFGVQVSAAPGKPAPGWSITLEAGGGGGYSATAGVSAAFTPTLRQPTLRDTRIFDYTFAGVGASLGGGGGLDVGVSLNFTYSTILTGHLP